MQRVYTINESLRNLTGKENLEYGSPLRTRWGIAI